MRHIFHLVSGTDWANVGASTYRPASLNREGFVHCSNHDQVARIANEFFPKERELLLLDIMVGKLTSPVRDEDPGCGEAFPHVYGPINREAIADVEVLARDEQGQWAFPVAGISDLA